ENYIIKPETQVSMTVLGRIRTEKNKKHWKNLSEINLRGARLRGVNLLVVIPMDVDLLSLYSKINKLSGPNLMYVDLTGADLWDATLMGANLWDATLSSAILQCGDLRGANLWDATLTGANLWGANLTRAYLGGVLLHKAIGLTVEQLLKVKTLYRVKGLPPEMEKEIKKKKPDLFEEPKER
ncbi:MAG: hypothetical protein GTO45_20575, partial [Candidatus Aminicenantes bacterium]|nr:hypothetical protein [Candidatus Aminicenantes bacterium]NIM81184.1 hypothetical protein [Candidatus Aminicenantes bacterium]NIN20559.1 hypothetical protein [Candidatus Aminicenantes bacterium]NIN44338.1 hypothetical protein [Candidatus Aminicenantes bacterium]NIN87157.1 hypothetical protein [Candidatus Aminicenantes bacterium]